MTTWIGFDTVAEGANPLLTLASLDQHLDLGGIAAWSEAAGVPDPTLVYHLRQLGYLAGGDTPPTPSQLQHACATVAAEWPDLPGHDPADPDFREAVAALTTFEPLVLPTIAYPIRQGARHLRVRVAALQLTRLGLYHGPIGNELDAALLHAFNQFRAVLGLNQATPQPDPATVDRATMTLLGDPYQMGARFFANCKPNENQPGGFCLTTPCLLRPESVAQGLTGLSFGILQQRGDFDADQSTLPSTDPHGLTNRFGLALLQTQLWMSGCYHHLQDGMAGAATVEALTTWLQEQLLDPAKTMRHIPGQLVIAPHCFVVFGFSRPTDAEVTAHETQLLALNPVALPPPPETAAATPKKSWLGRTWNNLKKWGNRAYASVRNSLVHAGRAVAKGALSAWQSITGLWQTALRCFTAVRDRLTQHLSLFWRHCRTLGRLIRGRPIVSGTPEAFIATRWLGTGDIINFASGKTDPLVASQQQRVDGTFSDAILALNLLGALLRTLVQAVTGNWLALALSLFRAWRPYLGLNTITPVWVR
ncbi:hypothetical protein [Acanthopleuribacter pedis]|uniref:Uncharacterized protein n=1 Tax=Acanthopleuribacter pedis TaxID=442870 RepID=A0A8J7U5F7_9BACT|nr:hypothetical protein [Acanthopleuribacter pedis]MBO1320804.1 hypothetical protein [Acanthopleuribacter pedis]